MSVCLCIKIKWVYNVGVTKVVCNSVGANTVYVVANKFVKLHISVRQ